MKTSLTGELRAAPDSVTDETLPSGTSILDFAFARDFPVQTGLAVRQLSDSGSFVALDGIGTTVTKCTFLVLRAREQVSLRFTQEGSAAQVLDVSGPSPLVIQFDPAKPLTLLEAKGVAKIEYFAAGPQ